MRYHNTLNQGKLVVSEEDSRRHRLRSVVLRDEVASLKDQLNNKEDKISQLFAQYDGIRSQLDNTLEKCREQEKQIRTYVREQSNLKVHPQFLARDQGITATNKALQAEMQSLMGASTDSTKLLSEKLALTRELGLLKPEVEHLRSQLAHQKDVLSQKLALERQLDALEVELANEKRAAEKATQKQANDDNEVEDELRKQIQELEKQLAAEKRETEKAKKNVKGKKGANDDELKRRIQELEEELESERAAPKSTGPVSKGNDAQIEELRQQLQTAEAGLAKEKKAKLELQKSLEARAAEAQQERDTLQQKFETMKLKLRETREDLKAARADAKKGKAATSVPVFDSPVKVPTAKPQVRRKRGANEISDDKLVMHTPNNTDGRTKRPLKKRAFEPTLVGEKSTFSITPFLNKTINFTEASLDLSTGKRQAAEETHAVTETIAEEVDSSTSIAQAEVTETTTAPVAVAKPAPKARGRPPKAKVLGEASLSKRNMPVSNSRKTALSEPTLEKVLEDKNEAAGAEQENRPPVGAKSAGKGLKLKLTTTAPETTRHSGVSNTSASTLSEPEPKKKKRKLLGAANKTLFDEEDGEAAPAPAPTKRKVLGGGARALGKAPMMGRGAFAAGGTFSPLKKERRGVNASFLA
ncbi:uncharacterized protein E0L32_000158 [Thyridium curvatum]|uniref:Uncharacterized protein n=1 Tax=Thyridium curvatum TaxID=1093900 RepID=A0A507BB20_9PEZI|nr:uncharacterized protein E0L32_000158 [Thyridium curvatum]TPX15824.1 hypothetical protein E0L32_000158 [Thyridium curvatum]